MESSRVIRLSAVLRRLLLFTLVMLACSSAQAAGIPPLFGSSSDPSTQPQADQPLDRSLDEVIQSLENDKQRAQLLNDLKTLRDTTQKAQPESRDGVLGLIGNTLTTIESQFSGEHSPLELSRSRSELAALLPEAGERFALVSNFALILGICSLLAFGLRALSHQVRLRFGLAEELPQNPRPTDLLRLALRKLGPWFAALLITGYLSYVLPASLGRDLAMVLAYALVVGTRFSAICVIAFSLLDGPHRRTALNILRRRAFRPLWLIGSFAAFGEALNDPRLVASLGGNLAHTTATLTNVLAALCTGLFILRFRRPIAHLIRNQPLARRLRQRGISETVELLGSFWYLPALALVAISLSATFVSAGDTSTAFRQSLVCTVPLVTCMLINGLIRRRLFRAARATVGMRRISSGCRTSFTPCSAWPSGWCSSNWGCGCGGCR
nr:hypothetical protein [Pseudomonas argentinensis]